MVDQQQQSPPPLDEFYKKADALEDGRDVPVAGNLKIRVFSVKATHARRFADAVEKVVRSLFETAADGDGRLSEQGVSRAMGVVVPQVLGSLSDMVSEACVAWEGDGDYEAAGSKVYADRPDLARLPLSVQAACVGAWVEQSFAGAKFRPLADLVAGLVERTTGRKISIPDLLTASWSRLGSPSTTSMTGTGAPGGPTAGGPSSNTGATSVPPSDSGGST